ncbi:T-lymphocyte surface antigen Ly-9-like isoform X2 [Simochromis diagramma]|nr:T-lymphocyte surface antigen Ly-9-like isoform X2 [Simochromis diagramma]XP_039901059.1 T-lymphocyte surface antigen Ly-9-like isoform X2 [Simochromis diagramma]XP_039901060.1 T-lymphocyte surface antigen Ly-9-like isoform X2 [Simochromis diagramma]XP_039901061.1 T-lymphocyte surface antigen Ly-9-like isoform X2 [Simochromis diagramma]
MIVLLSFWIVTGLMAEDPTATYYQLKNSSVCLNVRKPPPYKRGEWKFNTIFIADDTEINPIYKHRVTYSAGNLSLCINNLADTDTGIYEVSYSQNFISMSEKHQVIVQDVVPRPVIIMSKLGSNQSAGLCSITVNCSIQDYWLWSVCDKDGCRTSQKSFSEVNITIFTENRAVVCRGNNHVSTNKASENLMCFKSNKDEEKSQQLIVKGRLIPVSVLIILGVFSFFFVKTKYKSYQSRVSSSNDPGPVYENMDIFQSIQTSSPREEMISMESHKADTIYNCPEVMACSGNNTQSVSESATMGKAQTSKQIDSVYSMLQNEMKLIL